MARRTIRLGITDDDSPVDGHLKMMYRVSPPVGDGHVHSDGQCHVGWKIITPDGKNLELCLATNLVRDIANCLIQYADKADAQSARLTN